jgi:hypothetical protein
VKVSNLVFGMQEICCRFLRVRVFFIALLFNSILELSMKDMGICNFVDFMLFFTFYHDGVSVMVAPYFLLFFVLFSLALIAIVPHIWLSHRSHVIVLQHSQCQFCKPDHWVSGYPSFLNTHCCTTPFPLKSCN